MHAACLFDMLKKGRNFVWWNECQKNFDCIKAKVKDPAWLVPPLFDRSFVIQCDASDEAIGFMLAQQDDDQLRPIMFGGRVLIDIELRFYCIHESQTFVMFACL